MLQLCRIDIYILLYTLYCTVIPQTSSLLQVHVRAVPH